MEEMPKKPDHKSAWNVKINLFIVILVLSFGFFHILDKTIRGTPFSIKMDLLNRLDFKETRVKVFMENIDNTCRMRKYLFRNTTIRDDTSFSDDKCISRNDTLDGVFSYFVDDNFVETTCQKKRITFSETKMSKVALASYPGSGNTWLRHLIESVSGIATGSRNCGVVNRTFIGECRVDNRHTIVIKTHGSGTKKKYDKVVLVLRNPFDALLAEFNRLHANKTGVASKETFQQNGWKNFAILKARLWTRHARSWLKTYKEDSLHIVVYEYMISKFYQEFYGLATFLGVSMTFNDMWCVNKNQEGEYHRVKPDWMKTSRLYTPIMKILIQREIKHVSETLNSTFYRNKLSLTQLYKL